MFCLMSWVFFANQAAVTNFMFLTNKALSYPIVLISLHKSLISYTATVLLSLLLPLQELH